MYNRTKSRIFCNGRISNIFLESIEKIEAAVLRESDNYILYVNETEYVSHMVDQFKLDVPQIHFDQVCVDSYEDDIPAEYFPNWSRYGREGNIKMEVIKYIIPCTGDINLLHNSPASSYAMGGGGDFEIEGSNIVTEFLNSSNNAEEIKTKYNRELSGIQTNYETLLSDIKEHNNSLNSIILSKLAQRKANLLNKNNLLSSLGVPIKKKSSTPATFSVPKPALRAKVVISKPVVVDKGFKPEPTLDNENYRKILKLINDVGKNFERMPSVYHGKQEEDLRDHILMTLDPNFEYGSAAGETFNKSGKTDIQLRYDSSVLYIAECKFWSGEKNFFDTIDQLLKYLSWRDTKASIVIFVKQKYFTSILDKISTETKKHSNFLGFVDKSDENWFNFRFHINGDKNREVKLSVQLFHIP